MTSDEQRERAAFEAWIESKWPGFSFEWTPGAGYPAPFVEDKWVAWQARAAQQAPQARAEPAASSPSQPAGWKLVPVEPTPEMRAAAFNAASELRRERHGPQQGIHPDFEDAYWKDHETAWKAMLAAAPALVEGKK